MLDSGNAEMVERWADRRWHQDVPRLACASLRPHGPHEWLGQTSCEVYRCSGAAGPALDAETLADCAHEAHMKRRADV